MEIKIEEDKNMNHHQIKLVIHPQTRHIAEKMIDTLNDSLKNIKVYDDENNMYFIPVISIIYIEIIEHLIILLKLTNHSDYADQLFRYP